MNRAVFSIVLLALLEHSCIAGILMNTTKPQDFDRLHRAAIDIAMTCYGDPGTAIGIIGDRDGSILKELRLNHIIPVVLVNDKRMDHVGPFLARSIPHKLQVFVVAIDSLAQGFGSLNGLQRYIWWNYDANFLIVDKRPQPWKQCYRVEELMYVTTFLGLLNVQCICQHRKQKSEPILIWTSNPFVPRAPEVWSFTREYKFNTANGNPNGFLFARFYLEGGQSCESINFPKTRDVGGYRIAFLTSIPLDDFSRYYHDSTKGYLETDVNMKLRKLTFEIHMWLIDNIVHVLNSSAIITNTLEFTDPTISLHPDFLSMKPELMAKVFDHLIVILNQSPYFAVTQHTGHMTQLDKILSVIDRTSRIGMWVVYLITFLFFKFFLRQAVIPALLNLVRLTCNTGLPTLPNNVAATLYLTCLLMFVVTMQAIYTGNLATLLTTTIPYPNVQRKQDISKLGYKLYIMADTYTKLTADPDLDGSVIEIQDDNETIQHVLRDLSAACVEDDVGAICRALQYNLHVSKDPIGYDYSYFLIGNGNLFKNRIEEVLKTLNEAGLRRPDGNIELLRLQFVDDDEVKKNTERRVMSFKDLRFAFVILGLGLACSIICFVGEIVICRIQVMHAKRRIRVRVRSAWGPNAKRCSSFPSLKCRFNLRRLFSNRR